MVDRTPDHLPPPLDLDVPAARAAAVHYGAALAAGATEAVAWAEAVTVFRMHRPAWPLPLAEREAVRVVGGLIGARWIAGTRCAGSRASAPPALLLQRLARPSSPWDVTQSSASCSGAVVVVTRAQTAVQDRQPAASSP